MGDAITTVLNIPGTFIACVQCFEIIQYGRAFEEDSSQLVLRLEYIGLGLARWGQSLGIFDAYGSVVYTGNLEEVQPYLVNILRRFEEAEKKAGSYKPDEIMEEESTSLQSGLRKEIRGWMHKYATKYNKGVTKVKWAIYDKKAMDNLIGNLRNDIDDLMKAFPASQRQLQENEIKELEDGPLLLMKDVADKEYDETAKEMAASEIKKREAEGHSFENFDIEGNAGLNLRTGNLVGRGAIVTGAGNSYKGFNIRGEGNVHTGNEFQ